MRDETCYYLTACFPLMQANVFLPESLKFKIIKMIPAFFRKVVRQSSAEEEREAA